MKLPFSEFYEAFPEYRIIIKLRPDCSLLLTLVGEDGRSIRKVIESGTFFSSDGVRGFIHGLRRDIKLKAVGEVHYHDKGIDWTYLEWPTYLGGSLHMTAAKTLVARRKLLH